jgi:Villin headpiece domain
MDAHLVRSRIVEPYYQADFLEAADNSASSTKKERKIYPVSPKFSCHRTPRPREFLLLQIQQLLITNRKLPEDVDRNHLELHLSPEDFARAFHMTRQDFFRLPDWKRSEFKKRAKLY